MHPPIRVRASSKQPGKCRETVNSEGSEHKLTTKWSVLAAALENLPLPQKTYFASRPVLTAEQIAAGKKHLGYKERDEDDEDPTDDLEVTELRGQPSFFPALRLLDGACVVVAVIAVILGGIVLIFGKRDPNESEDDVDDDDDGSSDDDSD